MDQVSVNFKKNVKRSRDVSARLSKGIEFLMKKNNVVHINGIGRLITNNKIEVQNGNNKKIIESENIVIATQHDDMIKQHGSEESELRFVEKEVINHVIMPVLNSYGYPYSENFIVNGTGRFVYGGPEADTGLTGRKIIVDTYGGAAPHGGGAFSG